jgi:hypothetical protein
MEQTDHIGLKLSERVNEHCALPTPLYEVN